MKQTAVQWLEIQLFKKQGKFTKSDIEQSKAMEKEQIIDAYDEGAAEYCDGFYKADISSEQYYNETFKSE